MISAIKSVNKIQKKDKEKKKNANKNTQIYFGVLILLNLITTLKVMHISLCSFTSYLFYFIPIIYLKKYMNWSITSILHVHVCVVNLPVRT